MLKKLKWIGIAVLAAMLFWCAGAYAETRSGTCGANGNNLTWTLNANGILTISGTGAMADYSEEEDVPWDNNRASILSVEIGSGVRSISKYAFVYCSNLTSVTIPNSVISIGVSAFRSCRSLTSVTIPNSVTFIGGSAFAGCNSMTSLTISNGVTGIRDGTFSACISLTSVTIPNGVTSIGINAFDRCSSLTSITIPDSVTSIGSYAFYGCSGLTDVYYGGKEPEWDAIGIGSNNEPLNNATIHYSSGTTNTFTVGFVANGGSGTLESVNVDEGGSYTLPACTFTAPEGKQFKEWLVKIGEEDAVAIAPGDEITVTADTTIMAEWCYGGTCGDNLTWTLDDNGLLVISGTGEMEDYTLEHVPWYDYRASILSVEIENSVTSIGMSAFYNCYNLTSVTIGNGVTSIGSQAFSDCSSLTSVTIPDNVTSIGIDVFYRCYAIKYATKGSYASITLSKRGYAFREKGKNYDIRYLYMNDIQTGVELSSVDKDATSITIPNDVTRIRDYAFYYCSRLTSVSIPNSVTSIGECVFCKCSSLTSVTIPNSVTSIGPCAFEECSRLTSVTIPNSVTNIGGSAFSGCSSLTNVTIPNSVTSIGDCVFDTCTSLTSVTIPNSVTSIGGAAFSDCSSLTNVTIPNSVTLISGSAFRNCRKLTSVTIPNSVSYIYNNAFCDCTSLTTVTIGESATSGNTSIGDSAFSDCGKLHNLTIGKSVVSIGTGAFTNCSSLTSVTIPDSVNTINGNAFYNCSNLTSVTIPASVTSIGYYAFDGCAEGLTVTCFEGSKAHEYAVENSLNVQFLDFDWADATYMWAEDYLSVTAQRVSNAVPSIVQSETVSATGEMTKSPTCEDMGDTTYTSAQFENEAFAIQVKTVTDISALGHDLVQHDAKAATCIEIGWDAYETCTRCDHTTYAEIPALGHDLIQHDAKAATCTEIGWDAYETCTRCDHTTYAEIPALGHDLEHHEAQIPTDSEIGWAEYDTCKRDGCDYSTQHILTTEMFFRYSPAPTCTTAGVAKYICEQGESGLHFHELEIKALGHDLVQHEVKAPACTEIGWDAYETCTRCEYTTYAEIPALGHDWDAAKYEWSADHTCVTAERTCRRDASHTETETVDAAFVIVSPTEETAGSVTFTSNAFTKEAFAVQTASLAIPALKDMSVLRLPNMLRTIEAEAFTNLACQAIIIPEGCTVIGENAFAGCANLLYVRIPASVRNDPASAFEGCNVNLVIDWAKE